MNQTVKSKDLEIIKHYGVKGMKWAEKNQKAVPYSSYDAKVRRLIQAEFNTKPRTKLDEANAREKLKAGQISPDLFGLSASEVRQYYMLSLEDRKKFDALMVEKAKKGAFLTGREVLDQFKKANAQKDPVLAEKEKERNSKYFSSKVVAKLEEFKNSFFKESMTAFGSKVKK